MANYLKLLPALLPFVIFFAGGIGVTLIQSFGMMNPLVHYDSIWTAYTTILTNSHFIISILFSLYVALVSSILAIVFGTLLAYTIWKLHPAMQVKTLVYKIPLILPHIAVAFITMIFLSRSGIISSICHSLGIISSIEDFPNLIFSQYGIGEIVAYTAKESSFAALMAMSVLLKFDRRYLDTARQLGAGRMRIFFMVVLPRLREILVTTFLILFIYSFGAFEIPYMLGTASPGMLSLQVYNYYFMHDLSERPVAMALLMILFAVSALLAVVYFQISSKLGHKHKGSGDDQG
ncbi:sugar ABC transporter permease [Desulforhopalus vacuolatus]|uniref:ABC transporter permease n=1 Tax=Desulforhopalus vacuolatus TaxID=40414 RepID=UPI001964FD72|nr:ABC transporter permease subunit [Desulforhopalus vacuolatus]MBM9520751.1 sugar ABC transporter permease [Desulforhopalus vacuolatus]